MVEAATGTNIWREWARLENALLRQQPYDIAKPTGFFAGPIIALAKEKHPDTQALECPEVVRFLNIDYHIGIVYKSDSEERIIEKLDEAAEKITENILNIIPPKEKPSA